MFPDLALTNDDNEVDVRQITAARDRRRQFQQELLERYHLPLLCFTMNLAGPVKRSKLSDLAFQSGLEAVTAALGPGDEQIIWRENTGCEAFLLYDRPAEQIKAACMAIEEGSPVGRLYDLDVLTEKGEKLGRRKPRLCLLCHREAALCARSRAHGLEAVQAKTEEILRDFAPDYLARLGVEVLLQEANLTPKPGLVDRNNSGAHRDMDLNLFEKSAWSLQDYFCQAVRFGMEEGDCMTRLQQAGLQAEQKMLSVTGGVNTHRGAVYSFGLLLAGLGSRLVRRENLFDRAAALAKAGKPGSASSHGAQVRAQYGIMGARSQAEAGFPGARQAWQYLKEQGDDALGALLQLILTCDDTNLLYRGGEEGRSFAREWAGRVLQAPAEKRETLLREMDQAFIRRNLSPGGAADVLAQGLLLRRTECIWKEK